MVQSLGLGELEHESAVGGSSLREELRDFGREAFAVQVVHRNVDRDREVEAAGRPIAALFEGVAQDVAREAVG